MTDPDTPVPGTDPDRFDPVAFLEAAVRHRSHEDVDEMRAFLVETLADHGVEATVDAAGNVLASKAGTDPDAGPHVVCNTHIDTVTPHVPFERDRHATVEGEPDVDVIRGRGSCDAKGPLAALLVGFLATDPDRGRLTLAVTPDEEIHSLGAAALTGGLDGATDESGEPPTELDGDLYLVGEPTGLDVCTAAKGRFEGTIELSGETAHAAEDAGANAVAAAEHALAAVREFDADRDPHSQLGPARLTPTVIKGGGATNQVPDRCGIVVDRRSIPPETAAGFRESLERDVRAAVPADVGVAFELTDRESPFLEAFATDPDHELVRLLADSVAATRPDAVADRGGDVPRDGDDAPRGGAVRPFSAATEASYFAPAPTVVFGPGDLADADGAVAHADREYVRVREVEWAGEAVARTLSGLLEDETAVSL
ncbi:M20/M25/M40 family metallo-hydrolase [Halopenitus persicus]|uniref:Acetylornithine deacetylase n=1 Tax=Halopenitus persicus TaxID=1048396 RepID=A0A1H3J2L7_9EURY|nr:M20/M25/M40 family metallo-hydrolase [Halopenitus persicus]SDY33845.1 acetylornithine deacetylase [Halopenitus persicus]